SLGSNVTMHQNGVVVSLQGTLSIGSDTYNLDSSSININTGTPLITIGTGILNNEGTGTDFVGPQVQMLSTSSTIRDQSASGGELALLDDAFLASPNEYQGTINETGS